MCSRNEKKMTISWSTFRMIIPWSNAGIRIKYVLWNNENQVGEFGIEDISPMIKSTGAKMHDLRWAVATQQTHNVATTSRRCSDVETTLLARCMFAG